MLSDRKLIAPSGGRASHAKVDAGAHRFAMLADISMKDAALRAFDPIFGPMASTFTLTPASTTVSESVGSITFTITRSTSSGSETVYFSTVQNQGFSNNGDYTGINTQAVTFAAGSTSRTVSVSITNDTTPEGTETFGAIIENAAGTVLDSSTFTITDNDTVTPSTFTLTPVSTTVSESVGSITFTITRSQSSGSETVYFSTVQNQGFSNNGDYTGINTQAVTFAAGSTSRTVSVSITNDTTPEGTETFGAIIENAAGTVLDSSTFTITDNDTVTPSTFTLTPASTTVSESVGSITFTITRSQSAGSETVYFSTVQNQGFSNNGDYVGIDTQAYTFAAGVTTRTVSVSITNDTKPEGTETFGAIIENASGAVLDSSTFTITDNDTVAPSYSVSASPNPVNEGAGTVIFTITRSGSFPAETLYASTVNGAANGYAANSGDYGTNVNGLPVAFAFGDVSKTVTVSVTNDSTPEADESFGFIVQRNASDPVGTRLASTNWTIHDDDQGQATSYAISPGSLTVNENAGTVTFTVTRSGTLPGETVYLSTLNGASNGYPTNSGDYTGKLNEALTFTSGQASKSVTVSILNDSAPESDETFGLIVQRNNSDLPNVFLAKSTFTIHDDDTQGGTYSISPGSTVIDEGAGTVTFTVTRPSSMVAETLYVSTVQTEGSTNSHDYGGIANQALSFLAGQSSKTVTLSIIDDGVVDGNETFGLIVQRSGSDPLTAYLAKSTFTIQDNDAAQGSLSVSLGGNVQVAENGGYAIITLSLDRPATQTVSVQYYTAFGTASSGTKDYEGVIDQTVTFKPGEQVQSIKVRITDDKIHENTETFTVKLENPQGVTIGNDHAVVTVLDDDAVSTPAAAGHSLVFMATLAKAAYYINSAEVQNKSGINELSVNAQSAFDEVRSKIHLLSEIDLPSLSPKVTSDPNFPVRGIVKGIYTNGNAAALVGVSGDSLYISFRGTNDNSSGYGVPDAIQHDLGLKPNVPRDVQDWIHLSRHYDLFEDDADNSNFVKAIDQYIVSNGIKHVYVTGHSLGASMTQAFLNEHSSKIYQAITFASPGFGGILRKDLPDDRILNIWIDGDAILEAANIQLNAGDQYLIRHQDLLFVTPTMLHSMDLYLQSAIALQNAGIDSTARGINNGIVDYIDTTLNINLNNYSAGQWSVYLPTFDQLLSGGGSIFVSTPGDDYFNSLGKNGLFSTAHTTAPVLINLAPTWSGPSHQLASDAEPSSLDPLSQATGGSEGDAGFAQGDAIGTDRLVGIESILTGSGDDQIFGDDNANVIQSGAGNDMVAARGGDDFIIGGSGDGNDSYDGGDGVDTLDLSDDITGFIANLNAGTATGPAIGTDSLTGIENVIGGSGADSLIGSSSANVLLGGDGNDVIDGGAGADLLYGGIGDDSFFVDRQDDLVFENAGEGNDSVTTTAGYYLYANVERLNLAAGAGDIFGVGNELANQIYGNEGANLIIAGAGDDLVWGGAGSDSLFGQDGADQLVGDAGIDYLVGGLGNDSLYGEAGADALYGQEGDDTLIGGDDFATDIMVGGDGNDLFYGASGLGDYDLMDGGAGDDRYLVDTPADLTFEAAGGGNDTVYADIIGAGYYLYANVENLTLLGTTPFGVGNELNNYLTGNASSNYLLGGAGNDALNGKGGNDVLFGEGGADIFVFERGTGGDVIGDFLVGTDKIDLSALGLSWQTVLNSMHEVNGTTAIDLGSGDFIVLNGVASATLHAGDFILAGTSATEQPFEGRGGDTSAYEDNGDFGLHPEFDIPLHLLKPDGGPAFDFFM